SARRSRWSCSACRATSRTLPQIWASSSPMGQTSRGVAGQPVQQCREQPRTALNRSCSASNAYACTRAPSLFGLDFETQNRREKEPFGVPTIKPIPTQEPQTDPAYRRRAAPIVIQAQGRRQVGGSVEPSLDAVAAALRKTGQLETASRY